MNLGQQLQGTLGDAYTIERELGGGGMSRVFLAHERRLNRDVVIKVLSPELAAGVSAERFEREIQLAASLQQANIVPILAAGDTQGLPFYTMPYVAGQSVRSRLARSGPLPIPDVIGILRDAARALAYAHQHGVVHRDIKPDNVLLSGGTAVVTDFGIAKAISAARSASAEGAEGTLTQLGTSIGTPAYMAPEQAAGDPGVDHRADIYSLGCMAFEMLAGTSPFDGRTPARMLAAHLTEAPPPLGERRADVPAVLEALIARCLAKDPADRPQSADEIVATLDGVATGGAGTALERPSSLGRMLAAWAAVSAGVAIVARASLMVFGLPDWVFTGAVVVMLLGLPAILATWYVRRTVHHVSTASGGAGRTEGTIATLAVRASPHLTWRRTWLTGGVVLATFVLLVASFLVLRALGIGPAGSLLAAGKLADRERLIVTDFHSPDSSLSTLVTEAVRTNLGQSRVISIMPPVAVGAALQRMQRSTSSRIDFALAREIAQREGVKAIVDGAIRPLGAGFVVSMRLVSVDSADDLAAFQETANTPTELLEAIDELTRALRGRIGESLRAVRGSTPLEQVTTPSLEALRIYAEAARGIDMGGNPMQGAERLREAVRIDTAFAMAWRKLGVALSNAGQPRAGIDSALERAYRFRDRLTERERLLAEGTYYQLGPGRDRRRAIQAYERLLAIDPTESGAANNLGSILSGRRDFARAETLFKAQIREGRATSQNYTNLIAVLFNGGKVEESERYLDEYRERFPNAPLGATGRINFLYARRADDSLETLLRELSASSNPVLKVNGVGGLANHMIMQGRVTDAIRYGTEAGRIAATLGSPPPPPINDSLQLSYMDLQWLNDTARAVRRMNAVLARTDLGRLPDGQRPYAGLAFFYAGAGDVAKARQFAAANDADIRDSVQRRVMEPGLHAIRGAIARAEGRYEDALREFWRSDTTYDGPNGNCAVCILDEIAATWDQAGQADSAIVYYERYLQTPHFGKPNFESPGRAVISKRLGELYEATGDIPRAVERYREFVRLWQRADAPLQPKVAEVRRRLARLADAEARQP